MKRLLILLLLILVFRGIGLAQVLQPDTLRAGLLTRYNSRTLTKRDSGFILGARLLLRLKKTDTVGTGLVIKLITNTLSKTDSVLLKRQLIKMLNIDSNLLVQVNPNGLQQTNKKTDSIDLVSSSCSFEKEANAMIIYDLGQMGSEPTGVFVERHQRIKIFNDKGKAAANIRIDYTNRYGAERIDHIEGRTINFNNGKIEYTPLDQKLIYHQDTSKYKGEVTFSMPNVKPGSVVEIRYIWHRAASRSLPGWSFQSNLPTLYSQYIVQLYRNVNFNSLAQVTLPLVKDSTIFGGRGHVWAMRNIPSITSEPFMRSLPDGLQAIELSLTSLVSADGKFVDLGRSWATVGKQLADDKELEKTFDQGVSDKEGLLKWARMLTSDSAKVNYLFNQVKAKMKWNGERYWASKNGIKKAWENKSGNWGEVNMVLCRLLNDAGVKAYPLLTSTRDNGKMYSNFANLFQINKLVTYVPVDSSRYYVLDASGKYNNCNEVPADLLNSYGLSIDKKNNRYELVLLKNDLPVKQQVMINADIKPDGTMAGTAEIISFSYNKTNSLQLHNLLDEQKYKELLTGRDNDLTIESLKLENAEVDSLPLTQDIDFKLNLPASDANYIYFNPNLFTGLRNNPFINNDRFSDIDFGCNFLFSINGKYKIPVGYAIDALPKPQTITMPDRGITFKRFVSEEDGYVIVYYVINYKKSFFPVSEYPEIHDYFKKMTDLLNEQIVLKKT